ncbi:tRNA processing endoribonuclease-like protein Trz1 [Xylogone sp. PMI_703]|nr:tRNA processing endoribonuclease-like protein Trz1 [Xylogone sp. PMI_703]
MHEIVPVVKKTFISRLKARKPPNLTNLPKLPGLHALSPRSKPSLSRSLPPSNRVPLHRVLPGPRLRQSNENFRYLIIFEESRPDNISSVRQQRKGRAVNRSHLRMKNWVQILTTPTADTPSTALILHFDKKRYLFGNVGEGTQRACVQRKTPLGKLEDIFLTGPITWKNAGGLIGMMLTVADAAAGAREAKAETRKKKEKNGGKPEPEEEERGLNVHGGKNLTHLLATARRFVFRKGMPVRSNEFRVERDKAERQKGWEPTWSDENIKVWAMVTESTEPGRSSRKRSHEEFSADITAPSGSAQKLRQEQEDLDDQLRRSVLGSMFNSDWRLDSLVTKKLADVQMPAAIFIRNAEGRIEKYTGPVPGGDEPIPDISVLIRNPWPGALIESLPPTTPSTASVSYIVKNHPQRGKFDAQAAMSLGVKKGPNFRLLTMGQSVTTDDGRVITPDMVMSPTTEGTGFAVVELTDASHIDALVSREEWSSPEVMSGVRAIVWILGPDLIIDARLQKFMEEHKKLKHIISSPDYCPNNIALDSAASAAIRLHLLDSERFPIPVHDNAAKIQPKHEDLPLNYELARAGKLILLEPHFGIQDNLVIPYLDTAKVVSETSPEVLSLAKEAKKETSSPEYLARLDASQEDIPSQDAEVITLGTGSALPSKYRNVSATLVRVPGYGSYLLDCGENTLGQLRRVFGDSLPEVLRDLKAIWISHLHADHHLGTASVIKAWDRETRNSDPAVPSSKLLVASEMGMLNWLREYSEVEHYGYDRLSPLPISSQRGIHREELSDSMIESFGIKAIYGCGVEHCHGALAGVLEFPNGFKVAYSGDCRPSKTFARMGLGATLMIHEATFDDELSGDAIAKKHSTTSEALDVGKQMEARRILLTHFSQRYQKIPVMEKDGDKDQAAIVAFDYMRVKVKDMAKLESFRPALLKLYEEKED